MNYTNISRKTEPFGAVNSHVAAWLVANHVTRERITGQELFHTPVGIEISKYHTEVSLDVAESVLEPGERFLRTSKTDMKAGLVWVTKNPTLEAPIDSSKALAVSQQPGRATQVPIKFDAEIVDTVQEGAEDGCTTIPKGLFDKILEAYGVSQNRIGNIDAAGFAGIWPNCTKIVFKRGLEGSIITFKGNDKGVKRQGTITFDIRDLRLVALGDDYSTNRIWLSHMVTQLLVNGTQLIERFGAPWMTKITAVANYLSTGVPAGRTTEEIQEYYMEHIQPDILDLIDLGETFMFDENYDPEVDTFVNPRWADRLTMSRFAIENGGNPLLSPELANFTVTLLGIRTRDLSRGVPLPKNVGLMEIALPSRVIKPNEIGLPLDVQRKMGNPATVWVVRYPLNGPKEIVEYKVVSWHTVSINPDSWRTNHNGDFDKDLIFVINLPLKPKDFGTMTMPTIAKGAKEALTPYEEFLETRAAYKEIGRVCLAQELAIGLETAFDRADLKGLINNAGVAYNMSIQAIKHMDIGGDDVVRDIRDYARKNFNIRGCFWRQKKWQVSKNNILEAWNTRVTETKTMANLGKEWDNFVRTNMLKKIAALPTIPSITDQARSILAKSFYSVYLKAPNQDAELVFEFFNTIFGQAAQNLLENHDNTKAFSKFRRLQAAARKGGRFWVPGKWTRDHKTHRLICVATGLTQVTITPEVYLQLVFRWGYKLAKSNTLKMWSFMDWRHVGLARLACNTLTPEKLVEAYPDQFILANNIFKK